MNFNVGLTLLHKKIIPQRHFSSAHIKFQHCVLKISPPNVPQARPIEKVYEGGLETKMEH